MLSKNDEEELEFDGGDDKKDVDQAAEDQNRAEDNEDGLQTVKNDESIAPRTENLSPDPFANDDEVHRAFTDPKIVKFTCFIYYL